MTRRRAVRSWIGWSILVLALLLAGGCRKKAPPAPAAPPPPPPPAPAAPTVTLRAMPTAIELGESTTLRWNSTNATELRLEPDLGGVGPQGSLEVRPEESTTFTVVASGPGGTARDTARVTVTVPPAPPAPVTEIPLEQAFAQTVRDAFFDYDKSDLRPDARLALTQSAEFLRRYPQARVSLEGHCDERGSTEYNLGLGDRRANAARDFLLSLGVAAHRIQTVSYGKERPFCTASNEDCWQQNRRAHFVLVK